jgi:hypothetical protein
MALYDDPRFTSLAQRFGLRKGFYDTPSTANKWAGRTSEEAGIGGNRIFDGAGWVANTQPASITKGMSEIGRANLNEDANAGGAYALWTAIGTEGQKRGLANAFGQVYNNYKAARALNPQLNFTDFLDQVDQTKVQRGQDWFNRGERPSAYQGRYKFIGGG